MGLNREDNNFDEQSYVKVNDRLKEFWEKYPNGSITTFRTDTPKGVSYKAVICKDANDGANFGLTGIAPATGHSFLPYNLMADKVEEYTETVAVGRALAIMGFRVEKTIASAEEMTRWNENKDKMTSQSDEDIAPPTVEKLKTTSRFKMPKKT